MIVDGRYRVLETIIDSDHQAVYLTEHQLIRRRMIVKVLHAGAAEHDGARFVAEAEAAGRLRHPNIVESMDMGFVDDRPYVVFEHLQGARVSEEVARLGRLQVRRAVHIARQLAAALGAAHLEGIIHGGLDSDHVFLVDRETDPDFVKVLGLGKPQGHGASRVTPEALAPEQVVGAAVDHRCDVWSVGVMLYEMIVGRRPFSADAGAATARRRIVSSEHAAIDRPDVPPELVAVIDACLAKHPDDRFQDMAQLDTALAPFDIRFARGSRTTIPPMPARTPTGLLAGAVVRERRASAPHAVATATSTSLIMLAQRSPSVEMTAPVPTRTIAMAPPPRRAPIVIAVIAAAGVAAVGLWLALGPGVERAPVTPAPAIAVPAPTAPTGLGAAGATVERTAVEVAIEADTPGARVTFRRRVMPAPVAIEVAAADMVELVEVSAPGHRTVRYWITIDRPTRIHARLGAGTGLVEATELETLVALGEATDEVAAPAQAAAPAVAHDRDRSKRAPHRAIGRGADDPAAAEAATAPATGIAEEPPTDVAPAAAPEPFAERVPAPTAAPQPAPAVVKPAAPRQVASGFLEANRIAGNAQILPDNATRQAMHHVGTTRIVGKFKLCVTVAGGVGKVAMTSSSGYPAYDRAIATELAAWRFKPIVIGGAASAVCATVAIAYAQP